MNRRRLWVLSEVFYPEETGTGHILTRIAGGLSVKFDVHVICGRPSYASKGRYASWNEVHRGMNIERVWGTTCNKDELLKRLANMVTISCSLFLRAMIRLRRNDIVLVTTNPPLLPFLAAIACRLRGAKCVLLVHDVYPEIAIAGGLLRRDQCLTRLLQRCVRLLYRSVDTIVVLGRDMQAMACEKCDKDKHRVVVIPNFADVDTVYPRPRSENRLLRDLGLLDKFVVQYAGNMGPVHDIEGLVQCAQTLRDNDTIHFLVIGSGKKKAWLDRFVHGKNLANVTVLPPLPRHASCEFLNACDIAIGMFVPGMLGAAVPSRTYNVLAAGKPMIAVTDPNSEVALMLREEQVGWTVQPGDITGVVNAVLDAHARAEAILEMGRRARVAAETRYHPDIIVSAFERVLADLD